MEILLKWQEWLEHSKLYTEFLVHLPAPLNNVYFDLVILIICSVFIFQWILDAIAMHRRYKIIKKRQKKIQEAQEYADMENLYREREARHRQEQMDRQMKLMQMYMMMQYMPKQYQGTVAYSKLQEIVRDGLPVFTDIENNVVAEMPLIEGRNIFYLPQNEEKLVKNEFERLMELLGADEAMQKELMERKASQDAMAEQNERELDKKLKSETVSEEEVIEEQQISPELQKELERRKAMAVKLALKEQKRAERKQKWRRRK